MYESMVDVKAITGDSDASGEDSCGGGGRSGGRFDDQEGEAGMD
jgi:hypothetical protein